ncbi:MAG TPA: 4-hydroxyacetophenone monooxygenase, partial [Byssovorax sp.]
SDDYYPAIQRDHVRLVTDAIERVEANGVRTKDGALHEVDALILATGFEAAEHLSPFEIRGAGGALLADRWARGGEAYRGTTIAGFPNLFLVVGPNTGLGHGSMIFMIESQIEYVLGALAAMRGKGARAVDVKPGAQNRYNDRIQAGLERTVWATGGCKSWYRTKDGKNTTLWPGFMFQFRLAMRRFDVEAYHVLSAPRTAARAVAGG